MTQTPLPWRGNSAGHERGHAKRQAGGGNRRNGWRTRDQGRVAALQQRLVARPDHECKEVTGSECHAPVPWKSLRLGREWVHTLHFGSYHALHGGSPRSGFQESRSSGNRQCRGHDHRTGLMVPGDTQGACVSDPSHQEASVFTDACQATLRLFSGPTPHTLDESDNSPPDVGQHARRSVHDGCRVGTVAVSRCSC